MPRKVVALDIDTSFIRLLETVDNRVERWVSAPVEAHTIQDGTITDPEAVGAQVKRLMKSSGVGKGDVVASLSGLYSTSRILSLPPQTRQETIRQAPEMARDAIGADQMQVEWQLLRADETGQEMLVMGVPSSMLNTQRAVLSSAGLRPRLMEVRSTALARALDRDFALILNVESITVDIVLVLGGMPQIMRTVHLPGDPSPELLADRLGRVLEQTVTYYNNYHPVTQVAADTPLFLVGSQAEIPALAEELGRRVGYPLEPFVPPVEFPPHLPAVRYAVTIGLTLWRPRRAKDGLLPGTAEPLHINLVPRSPPFWMPTRERVLFLAGIIAGVVLAVILFQAADTVATRSDDLQQQLTAIENQIAAERRVLGVQSQKQSVIDQFEELTSRKGRLVELRRLVMALAPPGVNVQSFIVAKGGLTVGGAYDAPQAALDFVEALRGSGETDANDVFHPHFTSVGISGISEGAGSFSWPLKLADS